MSAHTECQADEGTFCDCTACVAFLAKEEAHYRAAYQAAPLAERDPARYESEMRDAGRGHLVGSR